MKTMIFKIYCKITSSKKIDEADMPKLTGAKSSNECIGIHYIILFFSMFETFIIKGKVIKKKLLVKWEKCFFLTIINS